ncbi:hypothetical protein BGX27_002430 [Mortierella sp. AM989]|nr:hypothetical protein BGX27_002430 [Mortierella sp. AM989]
MKYDCTVPACEKSFAQKCSLVRHVNRAHATKDALHRHTKLKRHSRTPGDDETETPCVRAPPPKPILSSPDAFEITVVHAPSRGPDTLFQLHTENIVFPRGASVVDGVVQIAGKPSSPLAWLDNFTPLSAQQKSNYFKHLDLNYQLGTALDAGRVCNGDECTSPITWRNVLLGAGKKAGYFHSKKLCSRCTTRNRALKFKEEYDPEGDMLPTFVQSLAPNSQVPGAMKSSLCAICSCRQGRGNSRIILGNSISTPLRFFSYCKSCDREQQNRRRQGPMGKFKRWIGSRLGDFESPDAALDAIMTVALQGFCFGSAVYTSKEKMYLCTMAKEASPKCFWSGFQLTVAASGVHCPTTKFTADRIVFHEGCALPYGAKEQFLVASSEFANYFFMDRTIIQRTQYLKKIEKEWGEGAKWADGVIQELQGGFDSQSEEDEAWTNEWEHRWNVFVKNKDFKGHRERVLWNKYDEWRFFVKRCQGRSLVTGQVLEGKACHIDRVFNSDDYAVKNCLMMEQGLNFTKRDMLEFQTSSGFAGQYKLQYGVLILRNAVRELLEYSRPHRDRHNEDTQVSLEGGHSDRILLTQQGISKREPSPVQMKLHQGSSNSSERDWNDALSTVSAANIEGHAKNFRKYCPDNVYISMIVAYPTEWADKLPAPSELPKDPSGVQQVVINISDDNFGDIFPQEHVAFINRLKHARKRSAEQRNANQSANLWKNSGFDTKQSVQNDVI